MTKSVGRRVGVGLLVVVGLAAVVAGLLYWWFRDDGTDPRTVELPPRAADQQAVVDYFSGPGRPLLEFLAATESLPTSTTPEACGALASQLDSLGAPPDLMVIAQGVPDPGIRDAAVNHLDTVGDYLAACGTGSSLEEPVRATNFSATVMRRLLDREGIR